MSLQNKFQQQGKLRESSKGIEKSEHDIMMNVFL